MCSGRVKINTESETQSKLQPSLFTERISRIYYFRVVLTTEKTNFSIECGPSTSLFEIFMDTAIDCGCWNLKLGKKNNNDENVFPLKRCELERRDLCGGRERDEMKHEKFNRCLRTTAALLLFKWEAKMKSFISVAFCWCRCCRSLRIITNDNINETKSAESQWRHDACAAVNEPGKSEETSSLLPFLPLPLPSPRRAVVRGEMNALNNKILRTFRNKGWFFPSSKFSLFRSFFLLPHFASWSRRFSSSFEF